MSKGEVKKMEEETLQEVLNELQKDTINTELIQDNKIHFNYKDDIYRVKMPNQRELSDAINVKNKLFIRLLQQEDTLTQKQLIKVLKEQQNIDIEELDKKVSDLEKELMQVYLTLAKKKDSEQKAILKLKEEINNIRNQRLNIILEKAGYLSPAIEIQADDGYYKFLTSVCTEKLINSEEDKWECVWKKYEDYEKDDTTFPLLALGKLTELLCGA